MKSVLLHLPGNEALAQALAQRFDAEIGRFTVRHFPDGETYLRIETELVRRTAIVAATFDRSVVTKVSA
ncbi:MAG: ribose-phosphate pyrophosphokinase-like domain-containing protein [Methylotenera sp.]|nr:ribose-phosphate pyrophosphokinase-like domain-containing protein [Methylotenera sp.]